MLLEVIHSIRAHKLRSLLTMFGIAWGILSLILMTSAGEGFRVAQKKSIRQLGQDIFIIWGGRTSLQTGNFQAGREIRLDYSDAEAIRRQGSLIAYVSPEVIRDDLLARTPANYGNFSVRGVLPEYQIMRTIEVARGRLMNPADNEQARAVCVIGSEVEKQLFPEGQAQNQSLKIDGIPFTVVGVMPPKEMNSTYSGQDHSDIFVPYSSLRRRFPDPSLGRSPDLLDNIIVSPLRHEVYPEAERQVRQILGARKNFDFQDRDAVAIWNTARQSAMIDYMLKSMKWFLGLVGAVTLLLGAVGVVNISLVSVRERTVEIGVRKSVGASRKSILRQFLSESMIITMLAGTTGLGLGWLLCQAINQMDFPEMVFAGMILSWKLAAGAFLLLVMIGVMAGLYPAYLASRMEPVEALGYEAD